MRPEANQTHAGLLALVFRELEHMGHLGGTRDESPAHWPDPGDRHRAPASVKVDLLARVYEKAGPSAILAIGRGARSATSDPFVRVLLARRSPGSLCEAWSRLEAYGHTENRTRFFEVTERRARLRREAGESTYPSFVENLLIVGILRALLEATGANGVSCRAALAGGEELWSEDLDPSQRPNGLDRRDMHWTLEWQSFTPVAASGRPTLSSLVTELAPRDSSGLVVQLVEWLADDIGRTFTVEAASRALATSPRTLQRRLSCAGLTFASVVRRVRVASAVEHMTRSDAPLTAIAYACGFADSAHLSREVKRIVGTAPSELRAMVEE